MSGGRKPMATTFAVIAFILFAILVVGFKSFSLKDSLGMYFRKRESPRNHDGDLDE